MNTLDVAKGYRIDIEDQPISFGDRAFQRRVVASFFSETGKVMETRYFGYMDLETVYDWIEQGKDINLDHCYLNEFSLHDYRQQRGLGEEALVTLRNFSAAHTFWDCLVVVNFSNASFDSSTVSFKHSCFGEGKLSFQKAKFGDADVDFTTCWFSRGDVDFHFAEFGDGSITFQLSDFDIGNVIFVNTSFGDGKVNFKGITLGRGRFDMHYSTFGKGDVSFDKARLGSGEVDFSKIDFGEGKVDFKRVDFGDGNISFDESTFGLGKVNFRSSRFGAGNVSFEMTDFGPGDTLFDRAEFGQGEVSFGKAKFEQLSFKGCHIDSYMDLRVQQGHTIDLSDTIVRDIIDLQPTFGKVLIKELKLSNMRNLGRIFIGWNRNKAYDLIANQDTSLLDKAYQFRILKEDFNATGKYNEEDKAYVEFKRFELRAQTKAALERSPLNAIWVYPNHAFKWLIFDKMGLYATDPIRVLASMIIVYVLFSMSYVLMPAFCHSDIVSSLGDPDKMGSWYTSFYHSAITFLTIGYGDYYPSGHARWVSAFEGFVGLFLMSYFTVAFVRRILR